MTTRLHQLRAMRAFIDHEIEAELSDGEALPIIESVAHLYDMPAARILAGRRDYRTTRARHAAAWLLHRSGLSLREVATVLGYTDHTTAAYACRKIERDQATSALLRGLEAAS
jgi:chromosomal replication initiation ATPase DnaA